MNAPILSLVAQRIATSVVIMFFVAAIAFGATLLLPGDVVEETLGQAATPELVKAAREAMGLDRPPLTRFLAWLGGMLKGDPGMSLVTQLPVRTMIGQRLPNSLMLAGLVTAISVPLALLLGITAAMREGSRYDRIVSMGTISMVSVPEFLIASVAVLIFAVKLRLFPALSSVSDSLPVLELLRRLTLPVLTLTLIVVAQMARLTRAAVAGTLRSPYIEMAILKGLSRPRVVLSHALPNAIGPIANAIALSLSSLLGGVVVVETIFNYPGMASLMVNAVAVRDIPVVLACAMLFCGGYLTLVTIADVMAILSNPRLRQG